MSEDDVTVDELHEWSVLAEAGDVGAARRLWREFVIASSREPGAGSESEREFLTRWAGDRIDEALALDDEGKDPAAALGLRAPRRAPRLRHLLNLMKRGHEQEALGRAFEAAYTEAQARPAHERSGTPWEDATAVVAKAHGVSESTVERAARETRVRDRRSE